MPTGTPPIRVLFLLPSLNGGGAERVAVNVLKYANPTQFDVRMALLRRAGPYLREVPAEKIDASRLGQSLLNFDSDNRESYKWWKVAPAALLAPFNTWWLLRKNRPHVVVSFRKGMSICTMFAVFFYGRKKLRWIAREGNNALAVIDDELDSRLARWFMRGLLTRCYHSADALLTIADEMASSLETDLGLPTSRVFTIHNAIDIGRIEQLASQPCAISLPKRFVVAVGRLDRQKGFDTLIRAFAQVCHEFQHDLVIVGEGSEEQSLKALAQQYGVAPRVHFVGFQDNPWSCMAKADLFVLSSRWEGFGNVVAEALACGVAALVTDCDFGPKEIVQHDQSGWVVPVDDEKAMSEAIAFLLRDDLKRKQLVDAGKQRVNSFGVHEIARRYESLFKKLAETLNNSRP